MRSVWLLLIVVLPVLVSGQVYRYTQVPNEDFYEPIQVSERTQGDQGMDSDEEDEDDVIPFKIARKRNFDEEQEAEFGDPSTPSPPKITTPDPPKSIPIQAASTCQDNQYLTDQDDCGKFYMCSNGKPFPMVCAKGLAFDPDINGCNYPTSGQCVSSYANSRSHNGFSNYNQEDYSTTGSPPPVMPRLGLRVRPSQGMRIRPSMIPTRPEPDEEDTPRNANFDEPDDEAGNEPLYPPPWAQKAAEEDQQRNEEHRPQDEAPPLPDNFDNGEEEPEPPEQFTEGEGNYDDDGQDVLRSDTTNDESQFKSVCYFTNWSLYRKGNPFSPEDIDPRLCTHIIYAFAILSHDGKMTYHDRWADVDKWGPNLYNRVAKLKKKGVKVMIAVGGWNDSGNRKYGKMLESKESRRTFIKSALNFLKDYGFQGIDVDYEYPACPQNNCKGEYKGEKKNFGKLIKELRTAMNNKDLKYLISAAVTGNQERIEQMYDVDLLKANVDFVNLMSYDYHGSWEKTAQHHSQLKKCKGDDNTFNVQKSVDGWIKKGMPKEKIVVGIPLYGRTVTLVQPIVAHEAYGVPIRGPGKPGPVTGEGGILSFYEICEKTNKENFHLLEKVHCSPIAYKEDEWIGYDNVESVASKAKYIKKAGLGGAMFWSLDMDDFRDKGNCCNVKYPLIGTANRILRQIDGYNDVDCGKV